MTAEKASTLRLLKEGMGNAVQVLESRGSASFHEVRAHLPGISKSSEIPILFLITSLAFLEASPIVDGDGLSPDFAEIDGWTPADFLSHLRFEDRKLKLELRKIRGRAIFTEVSLSTAGDLTIVTQGRGQSANRWLAYVEGRSHLREVCS